MGTNFFWFYDIVVVAVLVGVTFRSAKKGAVGVIISTVSAIVAFLLAFFGSELLSESVYKRYVAEPLTNSISESIEGALGDTIFSELSKIDMTKAVTNGKFLGSIKPDFDSTGKMTLDLSDVDLTETGMPEADLAVFGIGEDFDYSQVKLGTVEFTERELSDRTLGELVLARVLAENVQSGTAFSALEEVGALISEVLPHIFGNYGAEVSGGDSDAIYSLVLGITDFSYDNYGASVIAGIIDPIVKVPLRVILFLLIFSAVMLILGIIANMSKIINRIPVISSVNELLGGLLGLIKSAVIIFIICIGIQFLISLTDNSLVFLNTYTIDRTIVFRHIYHFNFIDFLEAYV